MLEKPKKMRRVCPAGSGLQPAGVGAAFTPAAAVVRMPPGCAKPESATTTWLAVNCRGPLWLNCTLARSTCGQVSPDPMVSAWLRSVAEAPGGGDVMRPD